MIDGLHVDQHVILVAMAIDTDGKKHVLGLREGATEDSTSCKALLADVERRGLRTDKAVLAVIDGSGALAKAIRNVFGERAGSSAARRTKSTTSRSICRRRCAPRYATRCARRIAAATSPARDGCCAN